MNKRVKVRNLIIQKKKQKRNNENIHLSLAMEAIKEECNHLLLNGYNELISEVFLNVLIGRAADGLYNIPADIDETLSLLEIMVFDGIP
jgi:folate-dependent phosphoribosylglycinamide formyltransferase PurN